MYGKNINPDPEYISLAAFLLPHLIQHVVFAIAGTFLYHVDHFRRYSTFCASLHKLKIILGGLQ